MKHDNKLVDGLEVRILNKTFKVADMERHEETLDNSPKGGSYAVSEVVEFAIAERLPEQEFSDPVEAVFLRDTSELERIEGSLSVEPFSDGTRFSLRTVPKPVYLPNVTQDTTGKAS